MFEEGADIGCQVIFSGGVGPDGDGFVPKWEEWLNRATTPAWRELMALPTIEERLAALEDGPTREVLVSQANDVGPWFDAAKVHGLGTGEEPEFDLEDSATSRPRPRRRESTSLNSSSTA